MSELEKQTQNSQLGSLYVNSDKTSGANIQIPIAGNDQNVISALGAVGFDANKKLTSATGGLALNNVQGHGVSVTHTHIPNFGKQLTGAGHVNLVRDNNHDLNANAFITGTMPTIPQVPNFNTVGGSLDYMYKNKVGASVGAAHTPFFKQTEYSASGNLNSFRNQNTSVDFSAGATKTVSPFTKSACEPKAMFSFRKFF